jgi:putative endonuclease
MPCWGVGGKLWVFTKWGEDFEVLCGQYKSRNLASSCRLVRLRHMSIDFWKMNSRDFGHAAEDFAAEYLVHAHEWNELGRRVRYREGELDLVMETKAGRSGELIFVEVKARRSTRFGGVVEALTTQKVRRMKRAIWLWRQESGDYRAGRMLFVGLLIEKAGKVTLEEHLIE